VMLSQSQYQISIQKVKTTISTGTKGFVACKTLCFLDCPNQEKEIGFCICENNTPLILSIVSAIS